MDIVQRCAPHIRNKWIKKTLDAKDDEDEYPKFQDFDKFMERVAIQSLHPVYGTQNVKSHKSGGKASSCHSVNSAQASPESGTNDNSSLKITCKFCNQYHQLFQCESFKAMNPKERRDFVNKYKLCYLCFSRIWWGIAKSNTFVRFPDVMRATLNLFMSMTAVPMRRKMVTPMLISGKISKLLTIETMAIQIVVDRMCIYR